MKKFESIQPHGDAIEPPLPGAQWSARISVEGHHEVIVVHGPDKESALALRRHMLGNEGEPIYSEWPTRFYGPARKPTLPTGKWDAWISAGGQHDAVIISGPDKDTVLALRQHILKIAAPEASQDRDRSAAPRP